MQLSLCASRRGASLRSWASRPVLVTDTVCSCRARNNRDAAEPLIKEFKAAKSYPHVEYEAATGAQATLDERQVIAAG